MPDSRRSIRESDSIVVWDYALVRAVQLGNGHDVKGESRHVLSKPRRRKVYIFPGFF
jgi:hypothetical protein